MCDSYSDCERECVTVTMNVTLCVCVCVYVRSVMSLVRSLGHEVQCCAVLCCAML